jgi:hypothetical protein
MSKVMTGDMYAFCPLFLVCRFHVLGNCVLVCCQKLCVMVGGGFVMVSVGGLRG